MNGILSWPILLAVVASGVSVALSRHSRINYFLAALTLLSLSFLSGLGLAVLLVLHPNYFRDDQAIPWIESLGVALLISAGGFLLGCLVLLVVASIAAVVHARHSKRNTNVA